MIPKYILNSEFNRYEIYDTQLVYNEDQTDQCNRITKDVNEIIQNGKFVSMSTEYNSWTYAINTNIYKTNWGVIDIDWDKVYGMNINKRREYVNKSYDEVLRTLELVNDIVQIDIVSSSVLYGNDWIGIPKMHIYFKLNDIRDISPIYCNPTIVKYMCKGFMNWVFGRGGITIRISKKYGNNILYLYAMDKNNYDIRNKNTYNDDILVNSELLAMDELKDEEIRMIINKTGHNYLDNEYHDFSNIYTSCKLRSSIKICTEPILLKTYTRQKDKFIISKNNTKEWKTHKLFPKQTIDYENEGLCLR